MQTHVYKFMYSSALNCASGKPSKMLRSFRIPFCARAAVQRRSRHTVQAGGRVSDVRGATGEAHCTVRAALGDAARRATPVTSTSPLCLLCASSAGREDAPS